MMTAAPDRAEPRPANATRGFGRRVFVGLVGAGAGATVLAGMFNRFAQQTVGRVLQTGRFRIYTVTSGFPEMALEDWRLSVGGAVEHPMTLDMDSMNALGIVDHLEDFHCVTGWSVSGVTWSGVPLTAVLDAAGAPGDRGAVQFDSFDGAYHESLTMGQARDPRNLIATHLDGEPLSRAQGFPARLVVPSMYGYKGPKWLSAVDVVDEARPGYWALRGYDQDGWVGRSNGYGA